MEIRKGDIVRYKGSFQKQYGSEEYVTRTVTVMVMGTDKDWYVIKNHISVAGCIVHKKEVKLIRRREDLRKWWNYIK
jgi:stalled ribosome rescue protein Dom34